MTRKNPKGSVFDEYLAIENLDVGLRRIAEAAKRLGLSMRGLAESASRDVASVHRTFDYRRNPRHETIDTLARAVGLSPIRLHAERDDLTEDERLEAFDDVLRHVGIATFVVSNAEVKKRFRISYRAATPEERNAAIRAWILSRASGDEPLWVFAQAIDSELLALFIEAPRKDALWMLAHCYRDLGFADAEIRRFVAPAIRELRRRKHPGLAGMLAAARNTTIGPINLEAEV